MNTMRKDQIFQQESKIPSFSSTLLDEIYRSIDESDQKTAKPIMRKKQRNVPLKNTKEDDEVANFRRARLVEHWMEKKATEKMVSRKQQQISPEIKRKSKFDNDALFFSSSSCSSDSSSGQFSSSETEIKSAKSSKKKVSSCFTKGMPKPKPIRTTKVSAKSTRPEKTGDSPFHKKQSQIHEDKEGIIKSKLKALNIYDNLKQPISPGARISTFINSIFATKNSKKVKKSTFNGSFREMGMAKTPTLSSTTCSSASSFTRSCLSKKSPLISENTRTNGVKRSVKFMTKDCKSANSSTLKRDEEVKFRLQEKNRKTEEAVALDVLKHYRQKNGDYRVNYEDYVNDDDDAASDCSSDLFELDHHKFSGRKDEYYCEELPVYETTHVVTNRAIANCRM